MTMSGRRHAGEGNKNGGGRWGTTVGPVIGWRGANGHDPSNAAFTVRVRAVHHWIRKGNPGKAFAAAVVAFHHAGIILGKLNTEKD